MPRSIKKSSLPLGSGLHRAYRQATPSPFPSPDCRLYLNFAVRPSRPRNSKQISWPDCAELTVHYPNDCCGRLSGRGSSSLAAEWAQNCRVTAGIGQDSDLTQRKKKIKKRFHSKIFYSLGPSQNENFCSFSLCILPPHSLRPAIFFQTFPQLFIP